MATINKRPSGKWQATVRHEGRSRSRTFSVRVDAVKWARDAERQAERGELHAGVRIGTAAMTLGEVLTRYRDEITATKRCADNERYAINGFLRSKLARVRIDRLTADKLPRIVMGGCGWLDLQPWSVNSDGCSTPLTWRCQIGGNTRLAATL